MLPESIALQERPPLGTAVALLQAEGLPVSDLTDAHMAHFFLAQANQSPVGLIGLERYGTDALLRSLAVSADHRRHGAGSLLVLRIESHASDQGVTALYLLTNTAEVFFARLGYQRAARAEAPPAIQTTREFAELCPATSAFMVKHIPEQR